MDKVTLVATLIVVGFIAIAGGAVGYWWGHKDVDDLKQQLKNIETASNKAKQATEDARKAIQTALQEQADSYRREIGQIERNANQRQQDLTKYLSSVDNRLTLLAKERAEVDSRLAQVTLQLQSATGEERKRLEAERDKLLDRTKDLLRNTESTACLKVPVDAQALRLAYSLQATSSER